MGGVGTLLLPVEWVLLLLGRFPGGNASCSADPVGGVARPIGSLTRGGREASNTHLWSLILARRAA